MVVLRCGNRRPIETIDSASCTGAQVRYDVQIRVANERRLMIDFMLSPVRDESGRVIHLIPSGVDISDRIKAKPIS